MSGAGKLLVRAQPTLLRRGDVLWRPLRRFKPVLRIKKAVILTRHADVRQVLERDDAFGVTYGAKMEAVTGPFILGWDDGPQYRAELAALRAAVRPDDLGRIAALTRERAAEVLARGGAVDAVALADDAVGAGLEAYFGLPALAGPARRDDARAVFRAVFLDGDEPAVLDAGRAGSAALVDAIRAAMAAGGAAQRDDVLGRLLAARDLPGEAIPRNLVGLVAAWAASVPRAFSLALDVLLDHPPELERAAAIARDGDEDAMATLLLDALRLQPQAPFLARRVRTEVVLAPGSPREHVVRPGDVVIAVTMSAMRDKRALDRTDGVDPRRDLGELLHFGAGIHTCFGAAISRTQFGALGVALLGDGPVRRQAPLRWGPAFPASLAVARG